MPLTQLFRAADILSASRFRPRSGTRTGGFTVLEVLVCLGIIGVLFSLLLPVLAKAHRVARRVQCQNNLKQINLAFSLYHDTFQTFPPGYVSRDVHPTDDAGQETGPGYAWGSLLLDFLDQTALVAGIDFNLDATDPANFGVASTLLPPWSCPVGGPLEVIGADVGMQSYLLASSSYVGMYGYGSLSDQPGAPPGPGILYRNSHVPLTAIRDGSSNTILIGERVSRYFPSPDLPPIEAGAAWFAAIPGAFRPAGLPDHPEFWEGPASLVLASVGQEQPFPLLARPNHTTYIGALSSNHDGGYYAGLADTSVRFISDQIDDDVLLRLGQHSDGEPMGQF